MDFVEFYIYRGLAGEITRLALQEEDLIPAKNVFGKDGAKKDKNGYDGITKKKDRMSLGKSRNLTALIVLEVIGR